MSLMDILLGSKCGIDIYEEKDKNTWVECSKKSTRIKSYTGIVVITIILIVILFFASNTVRIISVVVYLVMVVSSIVATEYYEPIRAKIEYERFENELSSYIKDGKTRSEAIKEIKDERLKREANQSRMVAAYAMNRRSF